MADREEAELTAVIQEIRERVRARFPGGAAGSSGIALPDLMPLAHARDKAEAKVAAIGTVNPRPAGLVNNLIQTLKKTVARAMDWHIREQVEFNRGVMDCVEVMLSSMNETNRALQALATQVEARSAELRSELQQAIESERRMLAPLHGQMDSLREETRELKDVRTHWHAWRQEWERKLSINEVQFLRSVADLQSAFQHRATLMEGNFRDLTASQHEAFTVELDRARIDVQQRLWADLERIRQEYEKLIHNELRVVRQRMMAAPASVASSTAPAPATEGVANIDYLRFAERFRGSEEYVIAGQRRYLRRFSGCKSVLDIGCGRGEFLTLLREGGIAGRGIDLSDESVCICRKKGLEAERADLFEWLATSQGSLDGIFCGQVVEHLPPAGLPDFTRLAAHALAPGGRIVIETPNPECLAIFASHFYLDPTHTRPVPAQLLVFYLEEAGFGSIEVERVSMAVDSMPSLASLPSDFREAFFGGLDYAVIATRL